MQLSKNECFSPVLLKDFDHRFIWLHFSTAISQNTFLPRTTLYLSLSVKRKETGKKYCKTSYHAQHTLRKKYLSTLYRIGLWNSLNTYTISSEHGLTEFIGTGEISKFIWRKRNKCCLLIFKKGCLPLNSIPLMILFLGS